MRELLDEDGENRAVRGFLILYGSGMGTTIGSMKKHLEMYGFPYWPDWFENTEGLTHLNKSAAQAWLRHLFALEQ